jgi:hypothetical protein
MPEPTQREGILARKFAHAQTKESGVAVLGKIESY